MFLIHISPNDVLRPQFEGAPAVSFRSRVNKLRALRSRRHWSPWPVTLPPANWPSAKGQTSALLPRPSPAPSHPLFVRACLPSPPHLPHHSRIPVFNLLLAKRVSRSVSIFPSRHLLGFLSLHLHFSRLLAHPAVCPSCLQTRIISWTELRWIWSRSGSGSTRLITVNLSVLPPPPPLPLFTVRICTEWVRGFKWWKDTMCLWDQQRHWHSHRFLSCDNLVFLYYTNVLFWFEWNGIHILGTCEPLCILY